MSKRILLLGYNFYPEPTGIGKYSGEMMQWLARHGYDCQVLTTYPYYPYWQVQAPYDAHRFRFRTEALALGGGPAMQVHRVPMYVPSKPSGLKRILLDISFSVTALGKLLHLLAGPRFDYVLVVAPSFQFGLLGMLAKRWWGARFIYHVQDMQIEAARDLGLLKSPRALTTLFRLEKHIFDHADVVSSISDGMVRRIAHKAGKPVAFFPNWADTTLIHPLQNKGELKASFNFEPGDYLALYSGAIGEKQGLEAVLHAAQEFAAYPRVKFVICGSGPYEQTLRGLATQMGLANVHFLPLQPVERLNALLNAADVHLVIQKANASDLVMPSKLTNILAVGGLVIITANPESSLYELAQQHRLGLVVPAENQPALNAALHEALGGDSTAELQANARAYAERYLAVDNVMQAFVDQVLHTPVLA